MNSKLTCFSMSLDATKLLSTFVRFCQ